jgi:RNA polymerase sigma factor (sigma-70 family)
MKEQELLPHLFRTEYRKIISVLCKLFGFDQIEIAEDITSDTFLTAAQTWAVKGIPVNPNAWLYSVAKNKAKNYLHRNGIFANRIKASLKNGSSIIPEIDLDLSPHNINDSQLQMMFAICQPSIPGEAQVGLSLRILCGFGIDEIASAFLSNAETISKRLFRAKEKLRQQNITLELPPSNEIEGRLENVLTTIYLLFNEGYYSSSKDHALRKDFCLEAMRLCYMLVENENTDKPNVNALLSLMCFHASRFDSRIDKDGSMILYEDQDTSLWNVDLISKGGYFLNRSASGNIISKYHLEANIAYWNTRKENTKEKWENILQLYNSLLQIEYSPVAALNRTFALSKANGKEEAIIEAEKLKLTENHFYFILLGELFTGIDNKKAELYFQKALSIARTQTDKKLVENKIQNLRDQSEV